ncbi:MAG: tRNA (adenosine(37)-N6)-threonylcarbamoyltransferase complex ATPase subunit type 1 TsaE [Bacteroidota bacterium]
MKQLTASNLTDLPNIASTILNDIQNLNVFAFYGTMGAGKTTLIKAFCKELGVEEVVTSPTFALINEYSDRDSNPVYHFDFYRIKKIDEVFDIGYEEYFYSDNYCFIEWPELVSELLPDSYVYISIEEKGDGKRVISYSIR